MKTGIADWHHSGKEKRHSGSVQVSVALVCIDNICCASSGCLIGCPDPLSFLILETKNLEKAGEGYAVLCSRCDAGPS